MKIEKLGDVVKGAFKEIKQYQDGEKKIIKTGRPYIDDVGLGLINGGVVLIAGSSGVGKSYEQARIIRNILDKKLNPNAGNYVSINVSLEMRVLSIVLRELEGNLKKDKRDLILNKFTEEEKKLAKEYYDSLQDDRQYISQTPTDVEQFYKGCVEFLEEHKDKEVALVSIDHLVLISSSGGKSKNQVVEDLIEKINILKMSYPNVVFLLLSQTNSENQKRAKDKDRMSQPKDLDIYYSQFSFQIADYVCVIQSPFRLGIKEYSKIYPDKYPHLKEYFLEEDTKGRVSLEGEGVLYYHLLKCREGGSNYTDIFAERLYTPKKREDTVNIPQTPKFTPQENPYADIEPNFDAKGAFDSEEDRPF